MLVTQQPVFKRFWYPVVPSDRLSADPFAFTLLGAAIVLWRGQDGTPAAVRDRCCHRTAQLSLGQVKDGCLVCPYHGWTFDGEGTCVHFPQATNGKIPKTYRVEAFSCQERYGYVWVCLGDPIHEIPAIAEAEDSSYRRIPEFYETWRCAGLRVMENELDLAHPTFVHTTTFGSEDHPTPDSLELEETEWGLRGTGVLGVVNPELQQQNLKMAAGQTFRTLTMEWFMPFTVMLKIQYPNGLVHIIVNTMTPIDDGTSQMVQFCLRNDTEADTAAADVVAFDRAVTLEDKRILESTDYDVPLVLNREEHMLTDQPGILIRKKVAALLRTHGETESTRHKAPTPAPAAVAAREAVLT
jgi:phenylpropionate dioxygenase-like ring-hydroxylating dioxygenase large terminal subunit